MVIDSSALLAILLSEPAAERIEQAINDDPVRFITGVSVVEASIVVESRYGPIGGRELDLLLHNAAIEVVPTFANALYNRGIAKRNRGLNSSFTVRKISHGEGVERVFQTHSPVVADIKVKRRGDVRRAKLYYLRQRSGKSARIKEKI